MPQKPQAPNLPKLRLGKNVADCLNDMNLDYKDLVRLQASAATADDPNDIARPDPAASVSHASLVEMFVHCRLKKEAMQIFIRCTKTDLALNNYVVRSKSHCCKS